jgi:hypothetical protein
LGRKPRLLCRFVREHRYRAFSEELPGNECSSDSSINSAASFSVAVLGHSLPGYACEKRTIMSGVCNQN